MVLQNAVPMKSIKVLRYHGVLEANPSQRDVRRCSLFHQIDNHGGIFWIAVDRGEVSPVRDAQRLCFSPALELIGEQLVAGVPIWHIPIDALMLRCKPRHGYWIAWI